jgi:hypothetical protein
MGIKPIGSSREGNQVESFASLLAMPEGPDLTNFTVDVDKTKGGFVMQDYVRVLHEAVQKIPKRAGISLGVLCIILGGIIDASLKISGALAGMLAGMLVWKLVALMSIVPIVVCAATGALEGYAWGLELGGSWGMFLGTMGGFGGALVGACAGTVLGAFGGECIVQTGFSRIGIWVGGAVGGVFSCGFACLGTCCLELSGEKPDDYKSFLEFNQAPLKTISMPLYRAVKNYFFDSASKNPYLT